MNKGDSIITNKNKALCIQDMHKQGRTVFLSGHLHKTEGFGALTSYNTDYSSCPTFSATRVLKSNDATKEVVKMNNVLHYKVENEKDLACVFHLDSIERNECEISGKEHDYFVQL